MFLEHILGTTTVELATELFEKPNAACRIVTRQVQRHVDIERAAGLGPKAQRNGSYQGLIAANRV